MRIVSNKITALDCADFRLDDLTAHIWRMCLREIKPQENDIKKILSDEERTRAEKIKSPDDKSLFILRSWVLRVLVQNYTGILADRVEFCRSAWGKPSVVQNGEPVLIDFNMAHSGDSMIVAFGKGIRLGVDLEYIQSDYPAMDIGMRFFTAKEKMALKEAPADRLLQLFFEIWVRKEAFVKAVGRGLTTPLDSFEVPLTNREECLPSATQGGTEVERHGKLWFFMDVPFGPSHKACLVTSPRLSAINMFDWTPEK